MGKKNIQVTHFINQLVWIVDSKTCLCKYIPLKWKEDAKHTLNKPGDSATQILCKDDITPGDCNGFLVPAVEIENQKMTYFIRVNLALKCLLESKRGW